MKYIVTTDMPQVSGFQAARLYRKVRPGQYVLSAQGRFADMRDLAKELNEKED